MATGNKFQSQLSENDPQEAAKKQVEVAESMGFMPSNLVYLFAMNPASPIRAYLIQSIAVIKPALHTSPAKVKRNLPLIPIQSRF